MNTEEKSNIPNILANLANFVTILSGLSSLSGILVFVQMYFSDLWVIKAGIAFTQIMLIVVLYLNYRANYGQLIEKIKKLQAQTPSSSEDCERKVGDLQNQIGELKKKLVANCDLSQGELETYLSCERRDSGSKDIKVSLDHLTQLQKKLSGCSDRFQKQVDKLVECLKKLATQDSDSLVHVYFTENIQNSKLAAKIYELLSKNSIPSTHLIITNRNIIEHEYTLLDSSKWIILLHEESEANEKEGNGADRKTLADRLEHCARLKKIFHKKILVCSSRLTPSEIGKYLKDHSDLIHPDNCSIELVKKIKGITDE